MIPFNAFCFRYISSFSYNSITILSQYRLRDKCEKRGVKFWLKAGVAKNENFLSQMLF